MKKISLAIALMVLGFGGDVQAQKPGWRVAMTVPRRAADDLLSVAFQTRHIGWAVGDGHTNYTGIYKTEDGGQNWERLDLFDGSEHTPDWVAIRFADAKHGWIAPKTSKFVMRTTDGGETWEPMDVRNDYVLANRILPIGTNGLIIAADRGEIHRTFDGGNTWQTVKVDEANGVEIADIVRPAPNVLIAVASYRYGDNATFYRSDNGGGNWELLSELPVPIGAIAFKDENNGVAAGKDAAFHTSDGGRTWKRTVASGWRNAITYVGDDLVGVGERPHVLISRNGGKTWSAGPALPEPLPSQLHDIAVVDPGWWFAPSDREARVYGFFDPENDHAFGAGKIVIPRSMRGEKSGTRLPPGTYDAMVRHVGYDHALVLTLDEPAEGVKTGVKGTNLGENEFACTECEAVIPVDLEYEEHQSDSPSETAMIPAGISIGVEPTTNGVAIVVEAAVLPPLTALPYLAALNVSPTTTVNVREEKKKSGGLLDRAKKAAAGDLKGAVAGANPKAAADRVTAAKASAAAAPSFYRIKLRYPLALVPRAGQQ